MHKTFSYESTILPSGPQLTTAVINKSFLDIIMKLKQVRNKFKCNIIKIGKTINFYSEESLYS